jgi:UDP:flavonoid glycosyltransferase YjiC (YdhE family)
VKVLFNCWPFEGHTFNSVAVANALRERGHEVAFYTGTDLQPTLEAAGLQVFPFRRLTPDHWLQVHDSESKVSKRGQSYRVEHQTFRHWLVESIPYQVDDLIEIIGEWQPDVLVSDVTMWGPITVLHDLGIVPVAITPWILGPLIPGPDAPAWGFGLPRPRTLPQRALRGTLNKVTDIVATGVRRRVDAIRAQYGLPALGCSINAATARLPLFIVGNLPELDYDRADLPPSVHYVGPCMWHPPEPPGTKEWLDSIPADRPWVHVTEGTSHKHQEPFVLKAAAQGLSGRSVELLLTTGRSRSPEELGLAGLANNVHVTQWLSHTELLPRCSALVTIGGASTIMAGLCAGVPLVIVPTTWDKPDNARRIVDAGAAIRLSPKRCTPDGVRAAVEEILSNPQYRQNARRIADKLADANGAVAAAEQLERLASTPRRAPAQRGMNVTAIRGGISS